ncbi:uncharacterized protein METZ01_LOCUS514360, partial [marine metagenome]
ISINQFIIDFITCPLSFLIGLEVLQEDVFRS